MTFSSVLETIGKTPIIRFKKIFSNNEVYIKSERGNPGGSIKDRIALSMIEAAEKTGLLKKTGVIIEPTSGNTGVGLALVAAVKGYKLILVMPESMSVERRRLMLAYGASFELTPKELGMKGAVNRALELAKQIPDAFVPQQFSNKNNVRVHEETTAQEILQDFPSGLDYLVTGVGTGGHITGVGKVLKQKFPNIKIIAVEPKNSPVLSGGTPGPHPIQGIGAGFIPKILDKSLFNKILPIEDEEAREFARRSAREEGLLVGISSGATLAAINQIIKDLPKDKKILGFAYDTGERYLSVSSFLPTE